MTTKDIQLSEPLRFLVVDDSRAIQAIIKRAIKKCGYSPLEIRLAINGEAALDEIESFVPHLVITDWHMPKVSGLEMVQALRQMGHKNMRVGFVTTEKTPALLDQAISNGVMFILHKPFDDAELVAAVVSSVKDLAKALLPPTAAPKKTDVETIAEPFLQAKLAERFGKIPFRLVSHDPMTPSNLTPSNLLGLYGATGHKGAYALGVLDANAICIVGGGSSRKPPTEVRAAMAAGQPDAVMLAKANEFMADMAQCLSESADPSCTVSLAKASVVKNTFAKLTEVLGQTGQRSDFRISIPGYGEGRMAWFVMR
jgi:CheY-like chemotaxis protein